MMRRRLLFPLLLCLLCAGRNAAAQEIGRLFTTPAERAVLERARQAGKLKLPAEAVPDRAAPVPEVPVYIPVEGEQILVVNGIVRRSGAGHETTWVDSVPHTGPDRLPGGARLARGAGAGKVALTLRSGRSVTLKPGQTVDAVTGKVSEAYQPAAVPKPRPAPESAQ